MFQQSPELAAMEDAASPDVTLTAVDQRTCHKQLHLHVIPSQIVPLQMCDVCLLTRYS